MESVWRAAWWSGCIAWAILVNTLSYWGPDCVVNAVTGQTAAAWVQAVGSIAAIYATWRIARRADDEVNRKAQSQSFGKVVAGLSLLSYITRQARTDVEEAVKWIKGDGPNLGAKRTEHAIRFLEGALARDGDPIVLQRFYYAHDPLTRIRDQIAAFGSTPTPEDSVFGEANLNQHFSDLYEHYKALQSHIELFSISAER